MISHCLRSVVFLLLSTLFVSPVSSKSTYYYYKQLATREGLSQSKVQSILNDHKGYLWVGTESGLNRYDREHLKQYLHHSNDKFSIPSDDITFIAEDSLQNLWIATEKGLCLYDRTNDRFRPILMGNKNLYVCSFLLLPDGVLFAGSGSLYKYVYATKTFQTLYMANDYSGFIPFRKMIQYDDKHILINTRWHGVYSYQLQTGKMKKVPYLTDGNYTSIYLDQKKRLWISAYGNGLFCYENGKISKHFTSSNSPLTYNVIYDMVEKDNKLWVATDGGGINVISLNDFSFHPIRHIQDDVHSFPSDAIFRLYKDKTNNIWVGSVRGGLIGIREVYARSYQNVPFNNSYGLSNQSVNSFFQDHNGVIWIATDGGGVNSFDPLTGLFKHYPSTRFEKVVSIIEYSPSELLFFSFDQGLFIFNKATGNIRPFIIMDQTMNDQTCINGFSVNIQKTANNKILLSAQHLFLYDIRKQQFNIVATMGKDYVRNSPLFIATSGMKTYLADLNGICEYDDLNGKFTTLFHGDVTINDACMDANGVFWLATTEGLASYHPQTKKIHRIQTNLFKEITSIVADNKNRIWIGTRHKLYVYSAQTSKFATLEEVDGVLPNEYIFHAMLLAKNGDILAGGSAGMTIVDANVQFDAAESHSIELLDVLLNGLPVSLNGRGNTIQTLDVPWDFSSLQLKVLLNEKNVFRKNIFQFKINGLNQELIQANSNSLNINYLPVGEYTIVASYYAQNGEWSPQQQILHLIVNPPWWRTAWAYGSYLILFSVIAFFSIHYFYNKRRQKQYREIENLKNKMYEDKIDFLTNISHELRTPLTLICAPIKRIIDQTEENPEMSSRLIPVYKQACLMKNIIDMVLDVRKLEEGKNILHILPYSLNEWVKTIGDQFIAEFEMRGMKLNYELDDKIKDVSFDKSKCEFVLYNFLMNAMKFSEPKTITTIVTSLSPEGDWVRVSVKDQGMGLNMVDTDSLFTRFYQGAHDKGGSGIGLSYSKTLIIHHKGKIGALANPDKGATFYFELPMINDEYPINTSASADSSKIRTEEIVKMDFSFLKNFSVLIVEDTLDLRNYLRDTLNDYFAHVYVTKDGKEGLEQTLHRLPDIIVSDVMMPRMNGFELCRRIKTNLDVSHIPVILLTAYHNSQNMNTGYKTGADAFLPKPFEVDGLLALIYNQIKLREQIKARYKDDKILNTQEISFSNADETFLMKLNSLISENISNPELDVNFMASNMCISRSLLFNKVKALSGLGIIDYVNKQRIDKAVILLTTTSMSLTEISEIVGFSSLRYFSRVFKSHKGIIPSEFKKQS